MSIPFPPARPLRVAIVAGELSGDVLGGSLLEALQAQWPGKLVIEGIGGPRMEAAGCRSLYPLDTLSVMGLVEVVRHYPAIRRCFHGLRRHFLAHPPDIFIGVDAPDFNLRLERALKAAGIFCAHYVSPTVWAWRENRLRGIIRACDLMLCLYPFEAAYYQAHDHPVRFVGHPLAAEMPLQPDPAAARRALDLAADGVYVALLPGSRLGEVSRLTRPFLQTAAWLLRQRPELRFLVPLANARIREMFMALYRDSGLDLPLHVFAGRGREVMTAADVILLASGTATLEAALAKRPMVVAYKLAPLTYWLAKRLVKVAYVSQPNLLADAPLVPEFLQQAAEAEQLGPAVLRQLARDARADGLQAAFMRIHHSLRRDAGALGAEAILHAWRAANHVTIAS